MSEEISQEQVNGFRMDRQYLTKRASRTELPSVVEQVCGIQAQMPAAAQLQLWARVDGLKPTDINKALWDSKSLLRTWCMRGTAHFISTREFPAYLEVIIKPRIPRHKEWLEKRGIREFGEIAKIDPAQHDFDVINQTVVNALSQGPATRDEMADIVEKELGSETRPWVDTGYYIVTKLLAYEGKVCFGPDLDGKSTLVRTDKWLPKQPGVTQERAENTILTKYLQCYGPATPQDFSTWSGLKMTTVTPIWERISDQLVEITLNEKPAWILKNDLSLLRKPTKGTGPLRLLPHFDIFLLGHKDKYHIVDETHYKRVFKKAAWIAPVLLCDGQAIGTWKQKRTGKKVTVTAEPFDNLAKSQIDDIEAETQRLGDYFELTPEMKVIS
ncbi:MAG: winged helix DNA-binding domain-containing protein [Candidatus Hermodarchaeota archaeon]